MNETNTVDGSGNSNDQIPRHQIPTCTSFPDAHLTGHLPHHHPYTPPTPPITPPPPQCIPLPQAHLPSFHTPAPTHPPPHTSHTLLVCVRERPAPRLHPAHPHPYIHTPSPSLSPAPPRSLLTSSSPRHITSAWPASHYPTPQPDLHLLPRSSPHRTSSTSSPIYTTHATHHSPAPAMHPSAPSPPSLLPYTAITPHQAR
jgi:hypothetical protein